MPLAAATGDETVESSAQFVPKTRSRTPVMPNMQLSLDIVFKLGAALAVCLRWW